MGDDPDAPDWVGRARLELRDKEQPLGVLAAQLQRTPVQVQRRFERS